MTQNVINIYCSKFKANNEMLFETISEMLIERFLDDNLECDEDNADEHLILKFVESNGTD